MQVDKGNVAPGTDALGRTWEEGWQQYAANHPEVLANWGYSHGRWCNCICIHCDPAGVLDASLPGEPVLVTQVDLDGTEGGDLLVDVLAPRER